MENKEYINKQKNLCVMMQRRVCVCVCENKPWFDKSWDINY